MNTGKIKGSKILIVDDNPGNLGVLFDYLNNSKFKVLIAQSGEDAIEIINENLPDIILMDILMPGIDGFETCQRLKADDRTKDIPVLFVSSLSETVDKVRGFEVGGVDYIAKPFQQEEVLARISTHLNIRNLKKRLEDQNRCLQQEIEERKKIEGELRKAKEESETASRAKSTFLANMSHEIRTPMNAILGFTDILERKIKDKNNRHYLELIRTGGKSLLRLINDILDLSKIEAGKLEPEYTAADIRSVFTEIQQIFSQKIWEKNLKFILEIDSELPESLLFDEARLRQVLLNLVGNAVKFTESGYIKVLVGSRIHDDDGNTLDLIFSVEDTGVGIPEDEREFIFGAFEQRKGQCISKYGGTGLGLAITKRLVEMMGGTISVGGKEGEGSIFQVVIKNISIVRSYDTPKKEKIEILSIRFKPALILIADDMIDNRMLLMEYLTNLNFKFIEAGNGREALDLAMHHCPDLILMDIRMPVMDGREATRLIKMSDKIKNTPVIAVTASAMKHSEKEITSLCDGYLKKPITKIELISELTRFLEYYVEEPEPVNAEASADECMENEKLCPETLERISELIQLLENKIEIWEDIVNMLTINDIEDFANHMIELGKEYKYDVLLKWGKTLMEKTMMFDMEALPKTLNEFPEIIKNLKKFNQA